jgi:ELWxxDGT repeat protein
MVTAADKSVTPAKSFLWTIDGTQAGNTRLTALNGTSIESGAEFKGHFYFGFDAAYAGRELWVTDGTRSGTQQFARLNTRITLEPRDFHVQDDWLYFTARHNNDKREIWRTNGNSAETTPVTSATQSNFTLSPSFYAPFSFTATGDALYFTALDTNQVSQLWRLSVEGVTACMIPPSGPWPPCARGGLIQ